MELYYFLTEKIHAVRIAVMDNEIHAVERYHIHRRRLVSDLTMVKRIIEDTSCKRLSVSEFYDYINRCNGYDHLSKLKTTRKL